MSRKRGPGKYHEWTTEEGLLKIEGWARDGLTDEQIAHNIGIVPSTLYEWKKKHSEISEALKKGKEVIDRQVENALLKRALGYEYEEVKQIIEKDEMGKDRKRIEKTVKQVIPDITAQIFWLKNRKSTEWRNGKETDARINKLEADTEYTKEKTKLLQGEKKDLTHLEELLRVMRDD